MKKRIANKTLGIVLTVLFITIFSLFSFFNSSIGDGGNLEKITFITSTPTPTLEGDGWWDNMPTSIPVEADPLKVTPTP